MTDDQLAREFAEHRPVLVGAAYRIVGSVTSPDLLTSLVARDDRVAVQVAAARNTHTPPGRGPVPGAEGAAAAAG